LVIVPNTGLNINAGIYGIMFMMALQRMVVKDNEKRNNYNIENILEVVKSDLSSLELSYVRLEGVRESLLEMKVMYNKSIECIYNKLYDYEIDISQLIRKLRYNFDNELNFISNNSHIINRLDVELFVSGLSCKDEVKMYYNILIDLLYEMGMDISVDDEINVLRSGKVIGRTKRYVRKLEFHYYIQVGETVNFVYGIERADKNRIIIEVLQDNISVIKKRIYL
jgi:hypothetical protein